jgi:hypothetical protein
LPIPRIDRLSLFFYQTDNRDLAASIEGCFIFKLCLAIAKDEDMAWKWTGGTLADERAGEAEIDLRN